MTTKRMAMLKGWMQTGTNTYMPRKTFEKYSMDNELTNDEKQNLYNAQDEHATVYEDIKARNRRIHLRPRTGSEQTKQQPQKAAPSRHLSEQEIQELNPVWIDERLEKLKHLHPQQLDEKRNKEWQ